ncbi:hypothetical protein REPUB_Repub16aG0136100 [Reevesia pubescens]
MDDDKKKDLIDDLLAFSTGKEKYAKIGKAWKRGYLLYGPPGTGKSTLILAMANLLRYDIYDLELTTVTDNTQLKTLLINLSRKGIVVVEDIDCSLDITGKRTNKDDEIDDEDEEKIRKRRSKVSLSGFLNFVDGIWSACGGENIFVFTTNHIDKLDPALIRKGRMDKHIELSYCTYQGFKVLAKNYLDIDSHSLFKKIEDLLGKVNMTPAEVSEHLIHITLQEKGMLPAEGSDERIKVLQEKAKPLLERLIQALETAKEEAREEEEATAAKRKEKKKRIVDNFSSVFKSKPFHFKPYLAEDYTREREIEAQNLLFVQEINIPNRYGGIEYLGFEKLTFVPIQTVVDSYLLSVEEIEWLNSYLSQVWEKVSPLLEGSASRQWL